jgi:hypothetical protein
MPFSSHTGAHIISVRAADTAKIMRVFRKLRALDLAVMGSGFQYFTTLAEPFALRRLFRTHDMVTKQKHIWATKRP